MPLFAALGAGGGAATGAGGAATTLGTTAAGTAATAGQAAGQTAAQGAMQQAAAGAGTEAVGQAIGTPAAAAGQSALSAGAANMPMAGQQPLFGGLDNPAQSAGQAQPGLFQQFANSYTGTPNAGVGNVLGAAAAQGGGRGQQPPQIDTSFMNSTMAGSSPQANMQAQQSTDPRSMLLAMLQQQLG